MLTVLPAVLLLYNSSIWSGCFLILIFAVSVWNGGGFYIEVFGRKSVLFVFFLLKAQLYCRFERELEALRKELGEAAIRSSGTSTPTISGTPLETDSSSVGSISPERQSVPLTNMPPPDDSWTSRSNHEVKINN